MLLASAGSKEVLEKMINEYYFSNNYVITDDNKIYNTKKKTYLSDVCVVVKRNRWRFERLGK